MLTGSSMRSVKDPIPRYRVLSFSLQHVPSVVSEAPHGGVRFSMYNDLNVYKKLCTF